jgi:DNA processing protein
MMATKDDLAALLAACEAAQKARVPWWQVGRVAARLESGTALLAEPWEPADRWEYEVAVALAHHLDPEAQTRWAEALATWQKADARLRFVTILDPDYPANLRVVFNPPPFLVLRGVLVPEDARGVAVVGTRHPSEEGHRRARRLGRELGEAGITVFSGLAAGIDTAAHLGALEAGARTVAVLGHGLLRPVYPKENSELAETVSQHGALVSQFRPDTPATKATFPMRNVVTSGLSQGTIVVEASRTSGARMQARLAAEQGKHVWLLRSLIDAFEWAQEFAERRPHEVRVVETLDDIIEQVVDADAVAKLAAQGLPPVAEAEAARRREPIEQQFALFSK